jgi:sulfur carrier protein
MAASIILGTKKIDVLIGVTIEDAMLSAGLFPDAFLFLVSGKPVPMTTVLKDGDVIETLRVASGG